MKRTNLRRIFQIGFGFLVLTFSVVSANFLFSLHRVRSMSPPIALTALPVGTQGQRILIVSPHPDDETLGCGGLIAKSRAINAQVLVVFLTNGDGFRVAVETQYRLLHVKPETFIQFGQLRQQEVLAADAKLGLNPTDIRFLGYPDGGLTPMFADFWTRCFKSIYTQVDRSPYSNSFRQQSGYCGANLLRDLVAIMGEFKPTDVYVTHPSDDHLDHTAASNFVNLAMRTCIESGDDWSPGSKLHHYIIHRGDWPVPQGLYKKEPLNPPSEMATLDQRWYKMPLTPAETELKSIAINEYRSQTRVTKRFLSSFARSSEVFCDMRPVYAHKLHSGTIRVDGKPDDWPTIPVAFSDPVNDSLLRDFQGGGDIESVYAVHDDTTLFLRIDTHRPQPKNLVFRLRCRYFHAKPKETDAGLLTIMIQHGSPPPNSDIRVAQRDKSLEIAIPLKSIRNLPLIALNIETSFAGIQIDKTGFRLLEIGD